MTVNAAWWIGFNIFVLIMIVIDLLVLNKKDHEVSIKESLWWTAFWIVLSLAFNVGVYFWFGHQKAIEFLTGYIIEKSLSVDNLFVFLVIFSYFGVPAKYQHRVLFFGIIIAMMLRAVFIVGGIKLIEEFHWVIYIFGLFLLYIAFKMMFEKDKEYDPSENLVVRFFDKFVPVRHGYANHNFFARQNGRLMVTDLFVVLITLSFVDIVFAVDSIPAIFAVTLDPFIVYTSNMFAILGLRALYFALAGIMKLFVYLKQGLAIVLGYVGIKMLIADFYKIPTLLSLGIIIGILTVSILLSIAKNKGNKAPKKKGKRK